MFNAHGGQIGSPTVSSTFLGGTALLYTHEWSFLLALMFLIVAAVSFLVVIAMLIRFFTNLISYKI